MAGKKAEEAAARQGHNLEDLKKKMAPALGDILKAFDHLDSVSGDARNKIKDAYDTAASKTGVSKRIIMREVNRIRRRQKERAEEIEMKDQDRDDIEALRAALDGTPLGKFAEGQLAQRIG